MTFSMKIFFISEKVCILISTMQHHRKVFFFFSTPTPIRSNYDSFSQPSRSLSRNPLTPRAQRREETSPRLGGPSAQHRSLGPLSRLSSGSFGLAHAQLKPRYVNFCFVYFHSFLYRQNFRRQ